MDEFSDFFGETVLIEPYVSTDDYGKVSYGPGVEYACRVDGAMKLSVSVNGEARSVGAMVYLGGTPTITPQDRITMPLWFAPQQPPILKVSPLRDESGPHHTEIAIGDSARLL